jgi:hypothetical protein
MGLESLLARLEGRFVSPVSPEKRPVIQENRLQNNAVSHVSPIRSGDKPESGLDVDTPASGVPPSWAVVPPNTEEGVSPEGRPPELATEGGECRGSRFR